MCFALKSWVFPVHSNFVLRSPEKLKISGLSTFYVRLKKLKVSVLCTFSVHLKNLKISVFCTFFIHQKNSRFQCSASRFTDKTEVRNKKCKKTEENSGCSMHLFYTQCKIFCGLNLAAREQFLMVAPFLLKRSGTFSSFFLHFL